MLILFVEAAPLSRPETAGLRVLHQTHSGGQDGALQTLCLHSGVSRRGESHTITLKLKLNFFYPSDQDLSESSAPKQPRRELLS